jgi:hypothetical protein
MKRCHWKEEPLQVLVNEEKITVVDISLNDGVSLP